METKGKKTKKRCRVFNYTHLDSQTKQTKSKWKMKYKTLIHTTHKTKQNKKLYFFLVKWYEIGSEDTTTYL